MNWATTLFATFSLFYNFIIPLLFNNGMIEWINILDLEQQNDFGIKKLIDVISIFDLCPRQQTTTRVVTAFLSTCKTTRP
jgi:hypothetical protein